MSQGVSVELVTHEHRFTGKVYTHGNRLLDMLNDRTTDYLHIHEVEVSRGSAPQDVISDIPDGVVRKSDLHLLIIKSEEHEAPTQRFFAFVQKTLYHVLLTVPGYEVRGRMHLPHQRVLDPINVLTNETNTFFPVTSATAVQAWTGENVISCPVLMVNKQSLSLFHIGEHPIE